MKIFRDGDTFWAKPGEPRLRVVLLTSNDPQHVYLRKLLGSHLDLVATFVEPRRAQQRRLWRDRRFRDGLYRSYQKWRQRVTGRARHRREYFGGLSQNLLAGSSPEYVVSSVNAESTREELRKLAPDLVVVCGTGIIGAELIEQVSGMIVNIHGGWLPDYKGNHGVYFAFLKQDWERIGATLHLVTPRLDADAIIERVIPELLPMDNDEHLYARSVHLAAVRLVELARDLERGGTINVVRQENRGTMYRHRDRGPLRELDLWIQRKTGRHRVPTIPSAPSARETLDTRT